MKISPLVVKLFFGIAMLFCGHAFACSVDMPLEWSGNKDRADYKLIQATKQPNIIIEKIKRAGFLSSIFDPGCRGAGKLKLVIELPKEADYSLKDFGIAVAEVREGFPDMVFFPEIIIDSNSIEGNKKNFWFSWHDAHYFFASKIDATIEVQVFFKDGRKFTPIRMDIFNDFNTTTYKILQ